MSLRFPSSWIARSSLAGAAGLLLIPVAAPQAAHPKTTGFYRVTQQAGRWWFVGPDGKRSLSLGACVVDPGAPRDRYCPERPEYAAFRQYPDTTAWARTTLTRLRKWGFNNLAEWADTDALARAGEPLPPYTTGLWVGQANGVPWSDLFSAEMERRFDAIAREVVLPRRDDPRLLGYFTDNELGWWDETIFAYHLGSKDSSTRQVLLRLLRRHYRNDFARLRRDFNPGTAGGFADLERPAHFTLKPGGNGRAVLDRFLYLLAERYYRLAHDAIRRYDPHHLILGDRYLSWYCPPVARAARKYVDVISTNYIADWTDGSIARYYFQRLHRLTEKPILVTEYYFAAAVNRSENRNSGAIFPTVATQHQRAEGARRSLESFASLPECVGAHWFQYYDEPTHGRSDGEDFNMGLVDIHDQPYEELTTALTAAHARASVLHAAANPIRALTGTLTEIPPAPATVHQGHRSWAKERALLPTASQLPGADLYACWDADRLYLAAHMADFADPSLYPGGKIADSQRTTLEVRIDGMRQPVIVRFGPGGPAQVTGATIKLGEWQAATRFTAGVAIPAASLRRAKLHARNTLRLHATLRRHGGGERTTWNCVLKLGR